VKQGIIKTRKHVGGKMKGSVVGVCKILIMEGRGVGYFYHPDLTRVSGSKRRWSSRILLLRMDMNYLFI
jgi:hypothetical protein